MATTVERRVAWQFDGDTYSTREAAEEECRRRGHDPQGRVTATVTPTEITSITEYGLTQRLTYPVRCF